MMKTLVGLTVALLAIGGGGYSAAQEMAPKASPTAAKQNGDALAEMVECHPRGGLPNVMRKLAAGEKVRVAYLGGSITEANGWRVHTLKWLRQEYPSADISEINAAISGTGSDFGVSRFDREVLSRKPDLLFVEFAVNDHGRPEQNIIRPMEGIVRKTWAANPETDICFLYTLHEVNLPVVQAGRLQPSAVAMERVAEHYGVPSINPGIEVAKLAAKGELIFTGKLSPAQPGKTIFSPDGVHPYPQTGHLIYLASFTRSFPSLQGTVGPHQLPEPLDQAHWQRAKLLPVADLERRGNWQKLDHSHPAAEQAAKGSGEFWVASAPGDSISFHFTGISFGLYGIKGPDIGQMVIRIDGGEPLTASQFDPYCTENRWRIKPWFYPGTLADGPHEVTISIDSKLPNKAAILKKPDLSMSPESQFGRGCWYVSDIIIVGEPVRP